MKAKIDSRTALRLSRVISAQRDRVFHAWTTPEDMMKWAAPEGVEVAECTVDLRVGGAYRIRMHAPENKVHTAIGTYREIDAPSRLVYTWDWEEEASHMGGTLVTVEFNELGDATEVVVTHEQFPNEEVRDGHTMGWTSCLNEFERLFA